MNITTITARMPKDMAKFLKSYCEKNNTNVSEFMRNTIVNLQTSQTSNNINLNNLNDISEVDNEAILKFLGSSTIGLLTYKVLKHILIQNTNLDINKIKFIAVIAGLFAFYFTNKSLK